MKEEIKQEILRRMKALKLHDEGKHTVVGSFRENGEVWKSEFDGILYWLDEEEKEIVVETKEENTKEQKEAEN